MSQKKSTLSYTHCSLWTALITPLDAEGNIHFDDLRHVAQMQAEAGNGILLLGSTGEGLALSEQEKWQVVTSICELALNVPIMVAVGGFNLTEQLKWIAQCNALPIDGYLLATPIYAKPGVVGQTEWFSALLSATQLPCMLYNVPSRSAVSIAIDTLVALQQHQNLWAMKEASGDLSQFLAYRQACPELSLFSGDDALLPYLASAGATGLVSVCSNAWPEATHQYVQLALQGDEQALFPTWQNAIASLFEVANPIPIKVLMYLQQEITHPNLRAPLTHLELASSLAISQADQQITDWLLKQNQRVQDAQQLAKQTLAQQNVKTLIDLSCRVN